MDIMMAPQHWQQFQFSSHCIFAVWVSPLWLQQVAYIHVIDGSEPMQNDQTYFFSDILLKIYNIIKI
jgi:hypothetical protein